MTLNLLTSRQLLTVSAMALAACLSSCSGVKTGNTHYSSSFDPPAHRAHNPSAVSVKISTGAQRLYVMEGSRVLLATPCSVGTAHAPTPAGNHTIGSKEAKRRSHSYGEYPMPYWCEFAPA